jgi:hypothetical protein
MTTTTRLALFGAAAVLLAGCGSPAPTSGPSLADAQALAVERGVPLLIDFYTDW